MTVREILHLALGRGARYESAAPEPKNLAEPTAMPGAEEIQALHERANAGDRDAQCDLGTLYYRGRGVTEDRAEAFKWLTFAIRQGDPKAQRFMEMIGPGLSLDDAYEGRRRIAAITGEALPSREPQLTRLDNVAETHPEAHAPGGRVSVIPQPADGALEMSADGDAGALVPEPPAPVEYIRPPALPPVEVSSRDWIITIAACLVIGAVGVGLYFLFWKTTAKEHQQVTRAAVDPATATTAGIPEISLTPPSVRAASRPLATPMPLAPPVAQDAEAPAVEGPAAYTEADVAKLRPKADAGDPDAQFQLALAYERGQGVPKDFAKAAELYTKSAQWGTMGAENNLGVLYINGTGVAQDFVQGYKWIHLASRQGQRGAAYNRDQLALLMPASQVAEALRQATAFERDLRARRLAAQAQAQAEPKKE